jgi:hypothetical protein
MRFFPMSSACPPLDFIVLLIHGEEFRLWSCSLCSFLKTPTSPFEPKIISSVPLWYRTAHRERRRTDAHPPRRYEPTTSVAW